ncbi:hypothetical protein [Kineosporia sp. NBRC 101731]|uniref:hypothetical protein n=1 Tax=Kineosporia sp. NBRC 101731 TaxID=3032199 RepID=UPI0024A35F6C|nr:hypothetical protein [Kineosporia sp. NBRC 101731]GLY28857.1 hypothetical protein Kisp02_22220 [Kineosporia sp. NBRC 101731]
MSPLSDWCFPQRHSVLDGTDALSGARITADAGSLRTLLQGLGMRPAIAGTAVEAFTSAATALRESGAAAADYDDLRRRTSAWITTAIEFGAWGRLTGDPEPAGEDWSSIFGPPTAVSTSGAIGLDALERDLGFEGDPAVRQSLRTRWLARTHEVASARLEELTPGVRDDLRATAIKLVGRSTGMPQGVLSPRNRSLVPIVAMLVHEPAPVDLGAVRSVLDRVVLALDLGSRGMPGGATREGLAGPEVRGEIHEMVPLRRDEPGVTVEDEVNHFGPATAPDATGPATFIAGTHPMANIRPVPQLVVEFLRDQVLAAIDASADPARHAGREVYAARLGVVLDERLLSTAWEELRSEAGFEIPVERLEGAGHAVALRLRLSDPVPAGQRDPDGQLSGQAVQLQRWGFVVPDTASVATGTELRTGGLGTTVHQDVHRYGISQVSLSAWFRVIYNQIGRVLTAGQGTSGYTILRSRETSHLFAYRMHWEIKLLGLRDAHAWIPLELPEPLVDSRLGVWFPESQSTVALQQDVVAPTPPLSNMVEILQDVPLLGAEGFPHAQQIATDVLDAFPDLADLDPASLGVLKAFLSDKDLRASFPLLAFGGGMPTPDLYRTSGEVLGYLRLRAELGPELAPVGPSLAKGVIESYITSLKRAQISVTATSALNLALSIALNVNNGLAKVADFVASLSASLEFRSVRTLSAGGTARMVRSLRVAGVTQRVRGTFSLTAELVRPAGNPLTPRAASRLLGARYPVNLQVPPNEALESPKEQPEQHLPPELLHLRVLGLSTTTTLVTGVAPLVDELEVHLRAQGYLAAPAVVDTHVANALQMLADNPLTRLASDVHAVDQARLANQRKLDELRRRDTLRAAVDNAIDGGAPVSFEIPTKTGTERISVTLTTRRQYLAGGDEVGVTRGRILPKIQTLNFIGSSLPGESSVALTPAALTGEANLSGQVGGHVTTGKKPAYTDGAVLGGGIGAGRSTTHVSGSSLGTGHEYYMMSPSSQGTTQFGVPVVHTLRAVDSYGAKTSFGTSGGQVVLTVPHYRLLEKASTDPRPVRRPPAQEVTPEDASGFAALDHEVVLPETALLEWVTGSGALQDLVRTHLGEIQVRDEVTADGLTSVPDRVAAAGAVVVAGPGAAVVQPPRTALGIVGGWLRTAWHALATSPFRVAAAVGGEDLAGAASHPRTMLHSALSAEHFHAHVLRIMRDSYVVEGVATSGIWSGQDVTLEIKGYLADVRAGERTPEMDGERWLQSTTGHNRGITRNTFRQAAVRVRGQGPGHLAPGVSHVRSTGSTRAELTGDNTSVMRVTTEDSTRMHPFDATLVYVVTIRTGRQNFAANAVGAGTSPPTEQVIRMADGIRFLLTDNDLHNHQTFGKLVAAKDPSLQYLLTPPADTRALPSPFRRSGGQIGYGTVTEVTFAEGRGALQRAIVQALNTTAPGITTPGTRNYLPGLLTLVNENSTSLGRRTLVNHGPQGHVLFQAQRRFGIWPQIITVTLTARPGATPLDDVRGRLVASGGMDNVISHISALGTALPGEEPRRTRLTDTDFRTSRLDVQPTGRLQLAELTPTLTSESRNSVTRSVTSTRELRTWGRTMDSAQFTLGYVFGVDVSVRSAYDHSLAALKQALTLVMALGYVTLVLELLQNAVRRATGTPDRVVLAAPVILPPPTITLAAQVHLRFQTGETEPADAETLNPETESVEPWRQGSITTTDPVSRTAARAETSIDHVAVPVGGEALGLTPDRVWQPRRPVQIYDVPGIEHLVTAVEQVAPADWFPLFPPTSRSTEGMFIRLNQLVKSERLVFVNSAAAAALTSGLSDAVKIRMTLYSPTIEVTSKNVAIDNIEVDNSNHTSTTNASITRSATFGPSGAIAPADLGGTIPIVGGATGSGSLVAYGNQLREVLRVGASSETGAGAFTGHRVSATAVFEVVGPRNKILWVTSRVVLRTTETPPSPTGTSALENWLRRAAGPTPGREEARSAWREGPARSVREARPSPDAAADTDAPATQARNLVGRLSLFGDTLTLAEGPEAEFLRSDVVPVIADHLRHGRSGAVNGSSLHEAVERIVDELHLQAPDFDGSRVASVLEALALDVAARPDLLGIALREVDRFAQRGGVNEFDGLMSRILLRYVILDGSFSEVPALIEGRTRGGEQTHAWLDRLLDISGRHPSWKDRITALREILVKCP